MQRNSATRGVLALCAATVAIAYACPATAQAPAPAIISSPSGTMIELARRVVDANPTIAVQRQQVRIAKARLQAVEANYLPTIEANGIVQKREIDVKNGGVGDARFVAAQASVEARVRVYDGDRTYNAIKIAQAELAAAEAVLEATISDTLLELLTAAADVHLDRKIRQYSELQSAAIGEQLRATARRLEFGESTRTDENLAKARLATSQAGIVSATEQLNVSGYRFRAVSGQSGTVVPSLPTLAPLPDSLTEAQTLAAAESPRLRAAQHNAEAGKKGVNFAAGALLPQLDAVGGYEYLTGGVANLFTGKLPDDRSALYGGIELRVPVFQPREFAEIRRARAVRDQRLSQTEAAGDTVEQEVATAWTRWQSAKSTIGAAGTAVAAIEKAAEGIKRESVEGNRTLADVLDAQNELLSARIALERAIRNEFVARAGVLAAIGALDADAVLAGGAIPAGDAPGRPEVSPLGVRPQPARLESEKPVPPAAAPTGAPAPSETLAGSADDPVYPASRPQVSKLGRKRD